MNPYCDCPLPLHTADANCLECLRPVHLREFHQHWHTGFRHDCIHCQRIERRRAEARAEMDAQTKEG